MTAPQMTTPTASVEHRAAATAATWLWPVAAATVVSAGVELVVLRIFTRTIIHIPGASGASPLLSMTAEIGRFTYYLSCVLLIALLTLFMAASSRVTSAREMVGVAATATFVIAAGGARAGVVGHDTAGVATVVAVVGLGLVATSQVEPRARLPVIAFSGAFALAAFDELVGVGITTGGASTDLRFAAEVLAVLAGITSPLLLRARPDHRSVGVGLIACLALVAMLTANSWTTTILMLWNFGLAGTLPWVFYGAAFGALACTLVSLVSDAHRRRAIALALLFAGGIALHSTYQTGLVIAGLALLGTTGGRGRSRPGRPATASAAVTDAELV